MLGRKPSFLEYSKKYFSHDNARAMYVLTFPNHLKQSKAGSPNTKTILQPNENQIISFVNTLKEYLRRTAELRKDQTNLVFSDIKPHKAFSGNTLLIWLRQVMPQVGVNTSILSPDSARAASVSSANPVNLDDTRKPAEKS